MTLFRLPLLALILPLAAVGCTSAEGEVCFKEEDCSSGLVCCKTTASPTARGRCLPAEDRCSVAPRPDASSDSGGGDGGGDAGDATTDAPTDAPVDTTPPMDASMPCDPTADECGAGYCRLTNCADAVGQCVERPVRCDGVLEPVCGCDSRTYTSACEAARSGVSMDRAGSCDSTADTGVIDAGPDAMDATTD